MSLVVLSPALAKKNLLEEIYSMLRRRPDGRSLGAVHDFLWQVAALLLGTRILSGAEFEALLGALERSTRKWGLRPVSRNYVGYLHRTFEGAERRFQNPASQQGGG